MVIGTVPILVNAAVETDVRFLLGLVRLHGLQSHEVAENLQLGSCVPTSRKARRPAIEHRGRLCSRGTLPRADPESHLRECAVTLRHTLDDVAQVAIEWLGHCSNAIEEDRNAVELHSERTPKGEVPG